MQFIVTGRPCLPLLVCNVGQRSDRDLSQSFILVPFNLNGMCGSLSPPRSRKFKPEGFLVDYYELKPG